MRSYAGHGGAHKQNSHRARERKARRRRAHAGGRLLSEDKDRTSFPPVRAKQKRRTGKTPGGV